MVVLMGLSAPDSVDVCLRRVFHTFNFVLPLEQLSKRAMGSVLLLTNVEMNLWFSQTIRFN